MTGLILSILLIAASCLIIWRSSDGFELAADFLGRKEKVILNKKVLLREGTGLPWTLFLITKRKITTMPSAGPCWETGLVTCLINGIPFY